MPEFSAVSREQLETCDERIQKVFNEVIKHFDCKIIEGHRGKELQDLYFKQGKSKLCFPNGKHNSFPSKAVDVMPYPINWQDGKRMCYFAGWVMATALSMGIKIRWGYDWNGNTQLNDETFIDGPHYEIVE
jgi:peptidoglycan L-alanyl-D-glutamate endopeptidase CwlK